MSDAIQGTSDAEMELRMKESAIEQVVRGQLLMILLVMQAVTLLSLVIVIAQLHLFGCHL